MVMEIFELVNQKVIDAKNTNFIPPTLDAEKNEEQAREVGQSQYKIAKIYYDKAELEKAEHFFLSALKACIVPKDSFAMLKITGFLVRIYSEQLKKEEMEKSIALSESLLNSIFSSGDWGVKSEYLFYLASSQTYVGKYEEANKNFNLAIKKAQESNEPEIVAKSLLAISQNNFNVGEFEESFRNLCQLEQLLTILNKGYLKGSMYLQYAQIYSEKSEQHKAIEYYSKSLAQLSKKSCWNLSGYIMLGMGRAYKTLGEYKKAGTYFELAKNLSDPRAFKKLNSRIDYQLDEVNDSNIDFIIDKTQRVIKEKNLGVIDFKHRFVLLEILYLLASNPGKHFDKDDLSQMIWNEEYNPLIHDKLIYTSISRLRKLIEPGSEKNKYIIRGKDGYNFSPHVKVRFCNYTPNRSDNLENVAISTPI
jgi:tetratricopeptide (TPR) repeat protein